MDVWTVIIRDASGNITHLEVLDSPAQLDNDGTVKFNESLDMGEIIAEGNWGIPGSYISVFEAGVNGGDSIDVTRDLIEGNGGR